MRRRSLAAILAACLIATCTVSLAAPPTTSGSVAAANPALTLHVAWLDGRSLGDAAATGAVLRDRFPDAVIVADERSALALRGVGYRVEGPLEVPSGRTVTLIRERGAGARALNLDAAEFEKAGATLLWSGGRDAIALSDGALPEEAHSGVHAHKALSGTPLVIVSSTPGEPAKATATAFAPAITTMVNQVSNANFMNGIRDMAGRATTVGGLPVTFATRATPTAQCDQAEQWAFERLQALGYTDVQYDPYTFGSTSARNVVATLPGTESPGRIVILGAHLDSTSPQSATLAPGANDNASGVAGLLETARILRGYSFKNTIKFIVFTGEEQGLYGSQHYASAAATRGDTIVGAVIYDMIGWKNALNKIDIEGETAYLPLMNVMNDACAQFTSIATNMVIGSWGSDHVPFQNAGYSAFLAIENEYPSYPCYHQVCDTVGWNQPVFGGETIKAGLATVAHIAGPRDFYISHTPLSSTENSSAPYEVIADISQLSPLVADSLQLHWSLGGGWSTAPLTATGTPNRWHAYIPAQSHATVQYWLSAKDDAGRHAFSPADAPASVHTFTVATRETLLAEGFEGPTTGWTHGGTKDEWQVSTPYALTEDPATAYTGLKFAGTDISGLGAALGRYENTSDTWFESPAVDCSLSTGVKLSFARKLAVERSNGGAWDYARVQVNGTTIWESSSSANTNDPAWTVQEYDISSLADGRKSVKIRWTLHGDGSVNYGGWNIDHVRITGLTSAPAATAVGPGGRGDGLVLHASIPNPAFSRALLRFELPRAVRAELTVFDVRGRRVRTLVQSELTPGPHEITWDGRDGEGHAQPAGVYFYRLVTPGQSATRRLTLLR